MTICLNQMRQKQSMYGEVIQNIDLSQQSLSNLQFEECLFEKVNLSNANLDNCCFVDCTFRNCNLSLAIIKNSRFDTIEFIECKLVGIHWYELDQKGLLGNSFTFDKCILTNSSFSGLTIHETKFIECKLTEVDFTDTDCTNSDFSYADCTQTVFHHTNLSECNFSYAINYNINIYSNTIKSAIFSSPDAINLLIASGIIVDGN